MSSVDTGSRFQAWVGQASNLDRCVRCSRPRSAHGADWSCPQPLARELFVWPLVVGLLLVAGAVILRLAEGYADFLVQAAFLVGAVLIVAGLTIDGGQRYS